MKAQETPVKREDQLAHLSMDMPPSPQPSASGTDKPAFNRENSMQTSTTSVSLPPDTQKFLKFAGRTLKCLDSFSLLLFLL